MDLNDQRGTSLAEAIVAAAIAAVAIGAALAAVAPALHHLAPDARSTALSQAAACELTIATDVAKYDGSTLQPNSIATTIPFASGTLLPATIALTATPSSSGLAIVVTAATIDGARTATARATIAARAPQPGSTFAPGISVPAPTGAP